MAAGCFANRRTHRTILATARSLDSCSRLPGPTAETCMQRQHERQKREQRLLHRHHTSHLQALWQQRKDRLCLAPGKIVLKLPQTCFSRCRSTLGYPPAYSPERSIGRPAKNSLEQQDSMPTLRQAAPTVCPAHEQHGSCPQRCDWARVLRQAGSSLKSAYQRWIA